MTGFVQHRPNRRERYNLYFAAGLPVVYDSDVTRPVNSRLHTGKEYLSFEGLHWYDNHARTYDPLLMRFTTPDPLAAQFPSVSPYAYCNNNPVNFIDPDGKKVVFAANQTGEFKQQFAYAIQLLNKYGVSEIFDGLEKNAQTINIAFGEETKFDANTMTIYWNPTQGLLTTELVNLSPITLLNHEGDHGLRYMTDPEGMMEDKKTPHPDYSNIEEKRVIEGTEQKTAEALGEVEQGKPTRKDHWGNKITVSSPDSNKDVNEIVIIGGNKNKR